MDKDVPDVSLPFIQIMIYFNNCNRKKLSPLEEADLWDIWYTGGSPFPAEVRQPNPYIDFRTYFHLAHQSIYTRIFIIWFTSTPRLR
jgi:hypothetical protein